MEFFLFNFAFLMFPLFFYLFYLAYNRNLGKEENHLFLDLSLLTSIYFTLRFGVGSIYFSLSIPLFLACLKKRYLVFIPLLFYISYYEFHLGINPIMIGIECSTFLLLYVFFLKLRGNELSFLLALLFHKILFSYFTYDFFPLKTLLCYQILFFLLTIFLFFLFSKGEQILKFHMNIKELEKEKQIQSSLFQITHEIKNPIAVCKGYLDMFDVENKEHARKYIPILKEEMDYTLTLLQDFLSITKIKIEKEIFDINYLFEELKKNFNPILKAKKIRLEFHTNQEEIFLLGDYNRIMQVFINLIKNSIESFDKEEKILKIETKLKKETVEIIVCDNGCGLKEKEKIGEAFHTTKQNGTGLGVFLSKEIIRLHNGKIKYQSKEGKYTKVIITLPLK